MHCNSIHIIALCVSAFLVCHALANSGSPFYIPNNEHLTTERNPGAYACSSLVPQATLDVTEIVGPWYANEIITHTQEMPSIHKYDFCVHVSIFDITDQIQNVHNSMRERQYKDNFNSNNNNNNRRYEEHFPQYVDEPTRYLRLIWMENNNNLEYMFNHTLSAPGIWLNNGEQRGTLATRRDYQQFHGSVHVLKAVNDHMVLTFCDTDVHRSTYTLVLARNINGLNNEELRSIRNLLQRRNLDIGLIGKVCTSAATTAASMHQALLALLLMCIIVGRYAI